MATLEELAAQFAAFKEATNQKISALEAENAELKKAVDGLKPRGARPGSAVLRAKTPTSLPKRSSTSAAPKTELRRNSIGNGDHKLTAKENGDEDNKSVDNFVKGKPPHSITKRTVTKSADIPKVDIDEKRIGSYQVGKRKVYYVIPADYKKTPEEDQPVPTELKLEYVYGYNGKSARNNLFFTDKNGSPKYVYSIAGTGVSFDPVARTQSFFTGHNEDILCLAIHPSQPIAATGQLDPKGRGKPYTCIWNYNDMKELHRIDGFHDRGVCAAAFSPDGKFLATVGNDDSHTVGIFDWEHDQKKPVTQMMVAKDEVYGMVFNTHLNNPGHYEFACYGQKLLKQFIMGPPEKGKDAPTLKSNILSSYGATKVVQKAFYSAYFSRSGQLVVGTATGELYTFKDGQFGKAIEAHKAAVGAVCETANGFASAGGDGLLRGWSDDFNPTFSIELGKVKPKSLDFCPVAGGKFVVGTASNHIYEVTVEEKKVDLKMEGHSGEIWGLATHPSEKVFVTCAYDKTLRAWDVNTHLPVPNKVLQLKDEAVCCNFSPDGKTIAIGFLRGSIALIDYETFTVKYEKKHRQEQVAAIAFSPNGQLLGVGSWDQMVELIDLESKNSHAMKGHTSSVTHLSFSEDSKFLMTNSRDYEILFWNTETGKRVDKSITADVKWWDFQCILGFPVRGIFGAGQDGTDNNAAHVSYISDPAQKVVATGNDTGEVSLFRYPASQKSMKRFVGHSAHVTNVRFTRDDSYLISTGGNDLGVFQWKHQPTPAPAAN